MSDLARLAKPFPPNLVQSPAQGKYGSYVAHHVVNQKLLAVIGPFDFEVTQIIRGEAGVEGCLARLTCTIDGRVTTITEVGDCEQPGNWKTDGQRLKDAASDALKRCAMRLGVGLHLWSQGDYFLYQQLAKQAEAGPGDGEAPRPAEAPPEVFGAEAAFGPKAAGEGASTLGEDPDAPLPEPSANRIAHLKARNVALLGAGVSIDAERKKRGIPSLSKCLAKDLDEFSQMLDELEAREAERVASLREHDDRVAP